MLNITQEVLYGGGRRVRIRTNDDRDKDWTDTIAG